MKLKFPLKIGKKTYPRDTEVVVLDAKDPRVRISFPRIKMCAQSNQVAILLPDRDKPIIHTASGIYSDGPARVVE